MSISSKYVPNSVTDAINLAHSTPETTFGAPRNSPVRSRPLVPSINYSAAYSFANGDDLASYHNSKYEGQRYCRDSNEIVQQFERYIETTHGDLFKAVAFNSGMSAIAAVLESMVEKNWQIWIPREVYRKARELVFKLVGKIEGVTISEYDTISEITPQASTPTLIWVETPSNPHLRIADYGRLAALKQQSENVHIAVDLTFAGLLNFSFEYEYLDAIIHSCTKYVGGHNDVVAGVALVKKDLFPSVWDRRSFAGGILDPTSTYLLIRSLRTYDIRIKAQLQNTEKVLDFLASHGEVTKVYYPGAFENEDQKTIFDRHHTHGGAVVSFVINKDPDDLMACVGLLLSTKMAPNFGSIDTQIEVPAIMSHFGKPEEYFEAIGLERNLVRYSVGCEPIDNIIGDLKTLLAR